MLRIGQAFPLSFHHTTKVPSLTKRTALKDYLRLIFLQEETIVHQLNIIFCSDQYLLAINKENLNHDYYTDIITFNLAKRGAAVQGEIYVSVDRVKDNARTMNQPFKIELHRVIFHGVLHLCGYRDKTKRQKAEMTKAEDMCLAQYFNNPTI